MSENTAAPTSERAPAAANAPQAASPALPPPDAPSPTPRRLLGLRGDIVTAAALALLTAAALILGEESVGFTRDEGVYFEAGRRYAAWFIDDFSEHGLSALKDEVIRRRKNTFLFAKELEEIMLNAQKEAYGDGLDPDLLHPYMWCCKSHYYSAGLSYYNFPYAFGGLFSRGLYAKYLEEGEAFLPKYRALLEATTVDTVENVARIADIDLTKPDFWRTSLQMIADRIDEFIAETGK